ncbi:Hypothetical predicted protein [Pelobates cultripes]|uniref:Uncharacterized protein n=1 Tax=Pelobates cultripes TaxID=61616 RepID=A0AAD1TIA7_PELCU|nr:Hypothetical predicted protein [Pelobates cultripes]
MTPVYNLSNKEFNPYHLSVLNKGRTFILVCKPDPFQVEIEMYKLKRILYTNEIRKNTIKKPQDHQFVSRSKKEIYSNNSLIKSFTQAVHKDALQLSKRPPKHRYNLLKEEKSALVDLMRNPSIVIRPTDKGGAIVIQTYTKYKFEILSQLNDE